VDDGWRPVRKSRPIVQGWASIGWSGACMPGRRGFPAAAVLADPSPTPAAMRRSLPLLLLAGVAACVPPLEEAASPLPAGWVACTNEAQGYTIAHPPGWHTNESGEMGPCRAFHPDPFELPYRTEMPLDLAVIVHLDEVALEETVPPTLGEELISGEPTTVAGREAFRGTVRSTGEGFLPAGIVSYRYHVRVNGATLIASTYDLGDFRFAQKREALDGMIGTLQIHD
jgi:hypothetical protein